MKFKNLFLVVLMVLVAGSLAFANSVSTTVASTYFCYGLNFLPPSYDLYMLSFDIQANNWTFGPYLIPGKGYGEIGCYLGRSFQISKKITAVLATVPITWQYEGQGFEMAIIGSGSISLDIPSHPSLAVYYAHLPVDTKKNGWYFSLSGNQEFFPEKWYSIGLSGLVSYNKGMFLEDVEGFGGMIEISKTLKLSEKLSLKGAFNYWMNDPEINDNKGVFLISLTHEF